MPNNCGTFATFSSTVSEPSILRKNSAFFTKCAFCRISLYLQSVLIHSANAVRSYTKTCRRVLTSTLRYLIGSESSCDLWNVTNLKNHIYNYNIYILNLVGRSFGKYLPNRIVSGGSLRFKISSFGCTLRRLLY
jgi:hypothetical protein